MNSLKYKLEQIYLKYNKFQFIHPDPLEFLYNYKNPLEQEIVGLIASSLAYGKVSQILISIKKILNTLGNSPRDMILNKEPSFFKETFAEFKHRFTPGEDIVFLLMGIRKIIQKHKSLEKCFLLHLNKNTEFLDTIKEFVSELTCFFPNNNTYFIPSPENGSACKRLMLYLRWMIRHDEVDPGCWQKINPEKLIIPLDTHLYFISKNLGFTKRKSADMKTSLEITEAFKKINKKDPVKYDFSLTRFGIRDDFEYHQLFDIVNKS